MGSDFIETKAAGVIKPKKGTNPRVPYDHQRDAIKAMDNLNKNYSAYSTLIVLPTGGGKTYTASTWLLRNALDKNKKSFGLHTGRHFWSKRQNLFKNSHFLQKFRIFRHLITE